MNTKTDKKRVTIPDCRDYQKIIDTHIPKTRSMLKMSHKLAYTDTITNGEMELTVAQQFGAIVTMKKVENIAERFPRLQWGVLTEGKWYERNSIGEWEEVSNETL